MRHPFRAGFLLPLLLACTPGGTSEAPMNDLFALTDRLVEARPLTKAKVERLTGVQLEADSGSSNPYYSIYVSAAQRGMLKRVELREARAGATRLGGLLILDLEPPTANVLHGAIAERYGKDFEFHPPTHGPANAPAYYTYTRPWGDLRFGFNRSNGLIEVVVIDAER